MFVSNARLNTANNPITSELLRGIMRNSTRALLTTTTITDSSTGVAGGALAPVNVQITKISPVGLVLSPRTAFNAAIAKVNNAIAVLATALNANTLLKMELTQLSAFNGTVVTPGTVAALDKALAAVDGTADSAMTRAESNAAIVRARNNFSMVVKAYNISAVAVGVPTLNDLTGGSCGPVMAMSAGLLANTNVLTASVATGDLASDAVVDAALNVLANNIAFVSARINTVLLAPATLAARITTILVP